MMEHTEKKLYRSRTDNKIAGVCGGIAQYFNVDSTWVRIIFILFLLFGGSAILVYVIMWLLVPLEPQIVKKRAPRKRVTKPNDTSTPM